MLREKRDTDLMRIRSILPCLHLRIIFMNSGRFLRAGAGQSLIGENADELPLRVLLDFLGVIGLLGLVAILLFLLFGGYPAVGRHAELPVFSRGSPAVIQEAAE